MTLEIVAATVFEKHDIDAPSSSYKRSRTSLHIFNKNTGQTYT